MRLFSGFRKGNVILDTIMWIVTLFVLIIAIVYGKMIFTDINADVQADDSLNATFKASVDTLHTNYSGFFDKMFLFVLIIMIILVLVASFMVDAHPAFFIVSVILMFILIFIGALFSNMYEELPEGDNELTTAAATFPIMNFVMAHILQFIVGVAILVLITLYAKTRLQ